MDISAIIRNRYRSLGRYRALYVLSALELIAIVSWILYANPPFIDFVDQSSYYCAITSLQSGKINEVRTPLYPLLLAPTLISGYGWSKAIVAVFQSLVFLWSIKWFGRTLENITVHKRVGYWFTAVYALWPGPLTMCGIVMTESLSLSMMTALAYVVSEACRRNSCRRAALSGALCLVLWMLRPALMPVTFLMLLFWLAILLRRGAEFRKTAVCGILAVTVSVVSLGIYTAMYYREYHKATLACTTTWNNYHLIRMAGVTDTSLIGNPDTRATVGSVLEACEGRYEHPWQQRWQELYMLHDSLGLYEFDRFVSGQVRAHPREIVSYIYNQRLDTFLNYDCMLVMNLEKLPYGAGSVARLIKVNLGTAILVLLTCMAVLCYTDIKRKRVSYFVWLLCSFVATIYFTVWIGAPDNFSRLVTPAYPALLAVSCRLLDMLVSLAGGDRKADCLDKC